MVKCSISKITPNDYKHLKNFEITYGTSDTKFGKCFIGLHDDSICFFTFIDANHSGLAELKKTFPKASFTEDNQLGNDKVQILFSGSSKDDIKLLLKGTDFQVKVWEELVNVPKGSTCSYEDLAKAIGNPKAVRAVANAVAKNIVPYFVPCHRVISKGGGIGKYGYGVQKKLHILKDENAVGIK